MDFKVIEAPSGKWNKVEVKKSQGKGNGVFAIKKIKKGEAICWYDGICCKVYKNEWQNIASVWITGKSGYNQNTKITNEWTDVLAGITQPLCKGGVASLINDYSNSNDPMVVYQNVKNKKYNCDKQITYDEDNNFKSYIVIAERNIDVGEELFVCYGEMYWTHPEKKWKDEDILKLVHKQNKNYKQDNNSIQDYIDRANIVKDLKEFW